MGDQNQDDQCEGYDDTWNEGEHDRSNHRNAATLTLRRKRLRLPVLERMPRRPTALRSQLTAPTLEKDDAATVKTAVAFPKFLESWKTYVHPASVESTTDSPPLWVAPRRRSLPGDPWGPPPN
jgi:hypothetical protein